MVLYSKEIKVGTTKINSNVTQQMIDDIKSMQTWEEFLRAELLKEKQELRKKKINQLNKNFK